MATKGERQALLFLAAVAALGAGTRMYRARRPPVDDRDLAAQIAAVDSAAGRPTRSKRRTKPVRRPDTSLTLPSRIDLDTAAAEAIERLPGIGPSLAKRIVANRDSAGPFGCLAALDSIKGVGPAMLRRLDSLVVFSGPSRTGCFGATINDRGAAAYPHLLPR